MVIIFGLACWLMGIIYGMQRERQKHIKPWGTYISVARFPTQGTGQLGSVGGHVDLSVLKNAPNQLQKEADK